MHRLLNGFSHHPWLVLAVLATLSAVAASQLHRLQIHVSAAQLLVMDDPERDFYQQVRKTFGDEQAILLIMKDEHLLDPAKLKTLKQVIGRLEALPFVTRTESLFSVPYLKTIDGYLNKDPYLAKLPATPKQQQHILHEALKSPFVRDVLLSRDGHWMAVAILLQQGPSQREDQHITALINTLSAPLHEQYQQVFAIGYPYVRTEIAEQIRHEQGRLFPLAVAALLIALFLLLRQLLDILIPILTASISILWTLGAMGAAGIPLNVVTSIIPILLIIVGSTEDIHLLSEYRHGQKQGLDSRHALEHMAKRLGGTILLTFVTTYAGFLSVGLSGIEALWQFGLVASTGLAFNFLATITLIPALLALAGRWQLDGRSRLYGNRSASWSEAWWRALRRYRKPVFIALALLTLAAAAGIPRIHIDSNAVDSLGRDSSVRQHFNLVNQKLAGLDSFSIVVDSGIQDTFLKARYLEQLSKIQQYIEAKGYSRSSTSFADYLALLDGAFEELDHPQLPQSDDAVNELMIFLNYKHVKAYVNPEYSRARILIRHNLASTEKLEQALTDIRGFLNQQLDHGLTARLTGESVLTLSATRAMIRGQLQSVALLLVFIVVMISLLFMRVKVGLLAAVPNLFPIVILFGVMGYAGIPLNIGTTMAAAIALGLAVDDTLHFMLRYNHELGKSRHQTVAMQSSIHSESLPILATSLSLMAGFLVFTGSDFVPIIQFGALSALVIATALLADLVITPLVISSLRLITLWDLLSLRIREQVLGNSPLFQGMRPWQIRQFILSARLENHAPQQAIFHRGDPSENLYLVMTGLVEIRHPRPGGDDEITECFGPGETFGEVALLAGIPRGTDAIAIKPSTLLALNREAIDGATRMNPMITAKLFLNLATNISTRMVAMMRDSEATNPTTPPGKTAPQTSRT